MKKMNRWILFLNDFENLPKKFVKNVKYMIQEEDTNSYLVMGHRFYKPLIEIETGEVAKF